MTGIDLDRDLRGHLAIAATDFKPEMSTELLLEYNVFPMTTIMASRRTMTPTSEVSNRFRRRAVLNRSSPNVTNLLRHVRVSCRRIGQHRTEKSYSNNDQCLWPLGVSSGRLHHLSRGFSV